MATPLGAGYSVLGWNYPGFGWSSVRIYYMNLLSSDVQFGYTYLVLRQRSMKCVVKAQLQCSQT
jgi:hypothetical protein